MEKIEIRAYAKINMSLSDYAERYRTLCRVAVYSPEETEKQKRLPDLKCRGEKWRKSR